MITHLADTSVLTLRAKPAVAAALQPYWERAAIARCSITDLEVCYSASNAREWDALHDVLSFMQAVLVTPEVVQRAKSVQRLLADRGLKGRKVADLIIAAAAELAGLTILHYDYDFELIASVTGQPQQWILPRGTVA